MATKFKCCKKDLNNYVCIICHNVFHSSCLGRLKGVKMLHEHYISCSEKCIIKENNKKDEIAQLAAELEKNRRTVTEKDIAMTELECSSAEEMEEMKNILVTLQTEIKQKDSFIKKLQKQIKDIEDEVYEEESKLEAKQLEQKRYADKLIKEITDMKEQNRTMLEQIMENKAEHKQLTNKLKELQAIRDEMIVSIETLEVEKNMYKSELMELNQKSKSKSHLGTTKTDNNNLPPTVQIRHKPRYEQTVSIKMKPKIRLIANSLGRGLSEVLNNLLGDTHSVHSVIKTDAEDDDLLKDAISEAKQLKSKDILIFWPNMANKKFVKNLVLPFNKIQTIIITRPYHGTNYKSINNLIYYTNLELKKEACKVGKGECVLECNNILRPYNYSNRGRFLNKTGKHRLSRLIKDSITNYKGNTECNNTVQKEHTETATSENDKYTITANKEMSNIISLASITSDMNQSLWEEMQESANEDQLRDSNILNITNDGTPTNLNASRFHFRKNRRSPARK